MPTTANPPPLSEEENRKRQDLINELVERLRSEFDERVAPADREFRKELALSVSAETYNNFRHWDVVKWATTGWLASVGVGAVVVQTDSPGLRIAAGLLAALGLVSSLLIFKLTRYHKACKSRLGHTLNKLLPGD